MKSAVTTPGLGLPAMQGFARWWADGLLAWLPAMLLYALLLRRHDLSKWFGWGLAASCASLHLDRLAARIRSRPRRRPPVAVRAGGYRPLRLRPASTPTRLAYSPAVI